MQIRLAVSQRESEPRNVATPFCVSRLRTRCIPAGRSIRRPKVNNITLTMLDCPTSSGSSAKEDDSASCKHCQATGDKQVYWGIQLDQDLLETIVSIYPEWFKDYTFNHSAMGDITKVSANTANQNEILAQNSIIPLLKSEGISKAEVDDASLQTSMDKNKESLKVKLLLRRPFSQLVEQGIMPSLKTSPAFHEQRQKLERAKMGDFLKNKIQRRPDRQELIQQHILEDTTVDPSLQDKQRQLKKARLADGLNDRLSHRPGPLELIKGNILKIDDEFAQAVREGQINYRRTCEGQALKFLSSQLPDDEDSSSEPALSPPQDISDISQSSELSPGANQGSPSSLVVSFATSPISSATSSPVNSLTSSPPPPPPRIFSAAVDTPILQSPTITSGNSQPKEPSKNRKKSKSKAQPKTRTIKFHEYKGPPNAHKNQTTSVPSETSYELLLQQQQLFLQWQLEWQQKYPQIIMPPAQNPSGDQITNGQPNNITQLTNAQDILRTLSKLEDMKVSDLKAELKRRKLPVSGSKPQLIERLKPYSEVPAVMSPPTSGNMTAASPSLQSNMSSLLFDAYSPVTPRSDSDIPPTSPMTINDCNPPVVESLSGLNQDQFSDSQLSSSRPSSVVPMDIDNGANNTDSNGTVASVTLNEDIVKMQQKRIEELQRELEWSHIKLKQQQSILNNQKTQPVSLIAAPGTVAVALTPPPAIANSSSPPPSTSTLTQESSMDTKLFPRQLLQQKLQQHQQSTQQAIPIISSQPTSAAVKASLAAFLHSQQNAAAANNAISTTVPLTSFPATLITSHVLATSPAVTANHITSPALPVMLAQPTPSLSIGEKSQVTSLPNGIINHKVVPSSSPLASRTSSLPNFAALKTSKPSPVRTNTEPKFHVSKAPPNYDEATKQLKSNQNIQHQFQFGLANQLSKRSRGQKSVKSQAVDDVLEILIKNGELPPSAAQEPPTPTTPDTSKSVNSTAPIFPASTISLPSTTPPPSTILAETESGVSNNLEFDFHLALDNIEAMDLGVLDQDDMPAQRIDSNLICQPSQCISQEQNQQTKGTLHSSSSNGDLSDFHQHGANMDIELCDWLDSVIPPNSASTTLSSSSGSLLHQPHSLYNCGNENDPLLSHMANTQDAFDLFSIEDMDFKAPSELSVLSWDKMDFPT